MGQTSLPSLNRSGVFSYWNSSWDSQYQYTFFLTRFTYLELFFLTFFRSSIFLFNFLKLKNQQTISLYFFKNFKVKKKLIDFKQKKLLKHIFCTSKLWVIKFSGWIVLSIYLLDTSIKIKKKKKKDIVKKSNYVNYCHILEKGCGYLKILLQEYEK